MIAPANTSEITLTKAQVRYLRIVLFGELHAGAEALADLANAASEGSTDEEKQAIAELDTGSAYQRRVRMTAELLDAVGWGGGE